MKRLYIGGSILIPYLLIAAVAVARLSFSHPSNLVPIFAVLLFFGACRPEREFGLAVLGLIGLDVFITTHHYGNRLAPDQALTWMWYLLAVNLGAYALSKTVTIGRMVAAALLASVSFFFVSNFSVWFEWNMYPKSLSGLGACYIAALPFLRNNLLAELMCSVLLFEMVQITQRVMMESRLKHVCS